MRDATDGGGEADGGGDDDRPIVTDGMAVGAAASPYQMDDADGRYALYVAARRGCFDSEAPKSVTPSRTVSKTCIREPIMPRDGAAVAARDGCADMRSEDARRCHVVPSG